LFLQNFLIATSTNAAGPLAITWSLAIEEQFYLVWPLIVRFCSSAQLFGIAITEICLSPALRFYLSLHHVNLYTNVFSRLDGLMAGAILALLIRSSSFAPARFLKHAWISFFLAAPLAFITEALSARWIVFSLTALASASFIYLSLFSPQKWLRSAMTNRFVVYTGTISYGLYLLHKIPFGIAEKVHLDRHPILLLPVILVLSFALAAVSWNILERPFLKLKRFFEAQRIPPHSAESPFTTVPQTRELT
jgi:peptidoglycan/LPS O-acetylase OafA/YrhL